MEAKKEKKIIRSIPVVKGSYTASFSVEHNYKKSEQEFVEHEQPAHPVFSEDELKNTYKLIKEAAVENGWLKEGKKAEKPVTPA